MTKKKTKSNKKAKPAKKSERRTDRLTGVPNDRVPDIVARIRRSPAYISHMVIPENGTSAIEVVFHDC